LKKRNTTMLDAIPPIQHLLFSELSKQRIKVFNLLTFISIQKYLYICEDDVRMVFLILLL
jgi:hypothetical protein